jgi:hypothetical protein
LHWLRLCETATASNLSLASWAVRLELKLDAAGMNLNRVPATKKKGKQSLLGRITKQSESFALSFFRCSPTPPLQGKNKKRRAKLSHWEQEKQKEHSSLVYNLEELCSSLFWPAVSSGTQGGQAKLKGGTEGWNGMGGKGERADLLQYASSILYTGMRSRGSVSSLFC